jgi:hypothetical protein
MSENAFSYLTLITVTSDAIWSLLKCVIRLPKVCFANSFRISEEIALNNAFIGQEIH